MNTIRNRDRGKSKEGEKLIERELREKKLTIGCHRHRRVESERQLRNSKPKFFGAQKWRARENGESILGLILRRARENRFLAAKFSDLSGTISLCQ